MLVMVAVDPGVSGYLGVGDRDHAVLGNRAHRPRSLAFGIEPAMRRVMTDMRRGNQGDEDVDVNVQPERSRQLMAPGVHRCQCDDGLWVAHRQERNAIARCGRTGTTQRMTGELGNDLAHTGVLLLGRRIARAGWHPVTSPTIAIPGLMWLLTVSLVPTRCGIIVAAPAGHPSRHRTERDLRDRHSIRRPYRCGRLFPDASARAISYRSP